MSGWLEVALVVVVLVEAVAVFLLASWYEDRIVAYLDRVADRIRERHL